jgi:hypothetical protein
MRAAPKPEDVVPLLERLAVKKRLVTAGTILRAISSAS